MSVRFLRKTNIEGVIRQVPDLKEGLPRGGAFEGVEGGRGLTPQCTLCQKIRFEYNKSVFIEGNRVCY